MNATKIRPSHLPRLLSVWEVAEHLGVCTRTVRRHIAAGALPTVRIGRMIRIAESDLSAYLARGHGWCPPLSNTDQAFQRLRPE